MSIASLDTTQAPQTFAAETATTAPASAAQGAFGAQLQSLLAGQSGAQSSAAQTAYQTEPGRGIPGNTHRHHGHQASGIDANAADGMENGQSTTGAQASSGTGGSGQQAPGGVLLSDLMQGLQAYGATTTLT